MQTKTEEIKQMNDMIQEIKAEGSTDANKEAAYLEKYNQMFSNHNHGASMTASKNVEEAFARGMIEHYQMAIDMAESILEYTEYDSVKHWHRKSLLHKKKKLRK